jgi:hypothetical protein
MVQSQLIKGNRYQSIRGRTPDALLKINKWITGAK